MSRSNLVPRVSHLPVPERDGKNRYPRDEVEQDNILIPIVITSIDYRTQKDKKAKQELFNANKTLKRLNSLVDGVARSADNWKVKSEAKQATNLNQRKDFQKEDRTCNIKEIAQNVTLHSGMDAGIFKPHGKIDNITTCAQLCCQDRLCDIAVVMTDRCYTVQCFSAKDCESKESENPDVTVAYMDNNWKNLKNWSSRINEGEHRKINKKTVVPNLSAGKQ